MELLIKDPLIRTKITFYLLTRDAALIYLQGEYNNIIVPMQNVLRSETPPYSMP